MTTSHSQSQNDTATPTAIDSRQGGVHRQKTLNLDLDTHLEPNNVVLSNPLNDSGGVLFLLLRQLAVLVHIQHRADEVLDRVDLHTATHTRQQETRRETNSAARGRHAADTTKKEGRRTQPRGVVRCGAVSTAQRTKPSPSRS